MGESTQKRAGVTANEIDKSGPTSETASGTPAGVIGTSKKGPAFVPIKMPNFSSFISKFGDVDNEKFAPMAMKEWFGNGAQAGTFVRTLGAGDTKRRVQTGVNAGKVNYAGFVVGQANIQANGRPGNNPHAAQADGIGQNAYATSTFAAGTQVTFFNNIASEVGNNRTVEILVEAAAAYGAGVFNVTIDGTSPAVRIVWRLNSDEPTYGTSEQLVELINTGDVAAFTSLTLTDASSLRTTIVATGGSADLLADADDETLTLTSGVQAGMNGRTYFLGTFMSESSNLSTIFREANIVEGPTNNFYSSTGIGGRGSILTGSKPIIRGVLMAASGVVLSLSSTNVVNNLPVSSSAGRYGYFTRTLFDGSTTPSFAQATFGGLESHGNNAGSPVGKVEVESGNPTFVILQNGFVPNSSFNNIITASFDPRRRNYLSKVLNTDPEKLEESGHLLYAHYDIWPEYATVTGSNSAIRGSGAANNIPEGVHEDWKQPGEDIAFMVTASIAYNSGTARSSNDDGITGCGIPNFEGFEDRYRAAFSPKFISQDFGDGPLNLFRFYALSDGLGGYETTPTDVAPENLKISITNIRKSNSTKPGSKYGEFDVLIRTLHDNDKNLDVRETFEKCNLDPSDENYIGRKIGDMHMFYEWDREEGSQKLVVEGKYSNKSNFVRVKVDPKVEKGAIGIDPSALPVGFRGLWHLVSSGSMIFPVVTGTRSTTELQQSALTSMVQPPVPMRRAIYKMRGTTKYADSQFFWGIQTTRQENLARPNKTLAHNYTVDSWTKYFPHYHTDLQNAWVGDNAGTADLSGSVLDADRFNNNMFTLERVQVITGSTKDLPNAREWAGARYRRDAVLADLTSSDGTTQPGRFLNVGKDFGDAATQKYLKFTTVMQGGFNGLDVFDVNKSSMSDLAVRREFDDVTNQGGIDGPTLRAYRKAIDILGERADADIQLLAIPGLRHPSITDWAIDAIEDRFDAMYIMDIEEKTSVDTFVTGSRQLADVGVTVRRFADRNLDTSFAAAYFPDVIYNNTVTKGTGPNSVTLTTQVRVPPTTVVLGAFAKNDDLGHPWFAPAGFTRGVLDNVADLDTKLDNNNLDDLYATDINPITSFADMGSGPVIFGQKTLLKVQSALDRVNVRRLLIDVRRKVKAVADTILFEPNRADTLAKFQAQVQPILGRIQQQQGLDRFKVQIDTSTTTQADVENNTIRGKIFLQPTRSVEFISLDFVITNKIDTDML